MSTNRAITKRLTFSVQPGGPIARLESIVGEQQLSGTITNMLNRYFALLHRSTPKFTDRELCALFDALGQSYMADPHQVQQLPREISAAISTDRLDAKWSVDAESLRNRLDRTSFPDRLSIAEMSAAYWNLTSEDEFPQVTIHRIKDLIQPAPSTTAATRTRRISPDLFDACSLENSGATRSSNPAPQPADQESHSPSHDTVSPELPRDAQYDQNPGPA